MELINATKFVAGYTLGLDPDGRERVVVVVKGTYHLPLTGEPPERASTQAPLVMADEFTGEPGLSATLCEADFAPFKPRCDVLVNGSAYAPGGRPAAQVEVGLSVGRVDKSFTVVGPRRWERALLAMRPSAPERFTSLPVSYDAAYGGRDVSDKKPDEPKFYVHNPAGVGYYPLCSRYDLEGKPLPCTAETGKPVATRMGKYRPMALGAIGRNFASRHPLAGTYDQDWLDNVFPFLPADFNPRYHQAAPRDQQLPWPRGGEKVTLLNLTPRGKLRFALPTESVPVEFTDADYRRTEQQAVLDTILIEPDHERLLLAWRTSLPLRRNIFEMKQCVIGRMPRGWYRARELGKTYYRSLAHLRPADAD
ncbi:MAG: DUF2169 domain-containing protein [bacterium]|nr:DUF2169 domain-containing protein [bacterium]